MSNSPAPFRQELKFLVTKSDKYALLAGLRACFTPDKHALGESYRVTSLYFDDPALSGYFDKLASTPRRQKYRLRTYNLDTKVINYEIKSKIGERSQKTIIPLSRAQYKAWLTDDTTLTTLLPPKLHAQYLAPRIIVDYRRTPLALAGTNLRLTFDEHLQMSTSHRDLFADGQQLYQVVLPPGQIIMEIKYRGFLPKALQQLLSGARLTRLAASKYQLATQVARSRYQGLIMRG